jgi:hypothetical protein
MIKRIVIAGAMLCVFVVALFANLVIVDVASFDALKESLGRVVSVVAVTTAATVTLFILGRTAMRK